MMKTMELKVPAPLDRDFAPLSVLLREYERDAAKGPTVPLAVNIEREDGCCDYFRLDAFPEGTEDDRTLDLAERMTKALLWMRGGWKITVCGSEKLYRKLAAAYTPEGERHFDSKFMGDVYDREFTVVREEDMARVKVRRDRAQSIGRHLNGCRIGFDAGGSDRKVSAVIDGETVYSEEVVWFPKLQSDPNYHLQGIVEAFRTAAAHMPRVDGIGVSSAGVYIGNDATRDISLFRSVPKELFESGIRHIYTDAAARIGKDIPLAVANDGDVTALAGAMDLGEGNVLGVAMGTSEAGGYVDADMRLMGWLTELAFVPVDDFPGSMRDEWSGDYGCGVKYFSQDAVIKLAPAAGIVLDESLSPAEKLKAVQAEMAAGSPGAGKIYETIGVYFGYAIAWYARFYNIRHVLIMGRVTSGEGGGILLEKAKQVLREEFPELDRKIALHIPDEKSRRVGQSVAAASLPEV